jgi:hypothetical protein
MPISTSIAAIIITIIIACFSLVIKLGGPLRS